MSKSKKTDQQWKEQLTPEQYRICREQGTEPAFTGIYWDHKEQGSYRCRCCGAKLFASSTKYDSGSGWLLLPASPARGCRNCYSRRCRRAMLATIPPLLWR